ncbi:MAG: hypothetical protein JKX76_15085 [Colwellia sp.]|nr:hypothetical protein [Colwellia sp.]
MAQDLAFCLYGNFNWPPNPENTNRGKTVPGYVLIRFIKDKDHFKTWLGWVPKDEKPPKGENEVKPFPTPRAGDRNICDPGEG